MADEVVDKRKVTMTSVRSGGVDDDGKVVTLTHQAVDYVRPDHLAAYVADARTKWDSVTVSDEPDAGPAGYHGQTSVPRHLPLADAGVVYEATTPEDESGKKK